MTMRDERGGDPACWAPTTTPHVEPPSEHALATLVRDLADGVVICDAQGFITLWNGAAERIFGWPAHEVLGQSLDVIIPERQRPRHWAGYARVMETGHTDYGDRLLEVPALRRDGSRVSIAFTVTLLRDEPGGRPTGIAAVVRDDTERFQERRALLAEVAAARGGGDGPGDATS